MCLFYSESKFDLHCTFHISGRPARVDCVVLHTVSLRLHLSVVSTAAAVSSGCCSIRVLTFDMSALCSGKFTASLITDPSKRSSDIIFPVVLSVARMTNHTRMRRCAMSPHGLMRVCMAGRKDSSTDLGMLPAALTVH